MLKGYNASLLDAGHVAGPFTYKINVSRYKQYKKCPAAVARNFSLVDFRYTHFKGLKDEIFNCRAAAVRCLGLYCPMEDSNADADPKDSSRRVALLRTAFMFDTSPLVQECAAKALCDLALTKCVLLLCVYNPVSLKSEM